MATEKNTAENLMEIFIERGSANEDPNFLVGINGVNYVLPRGKTSRVPVSVYDEIMRARRAQQRQDENAYELKAAAQQPK